MNIMLGAFVDKAVNEFIKNAGDNITPIQQNYIDILRNRDESRGIPTANNLCNSMGETREQAIAKASKFFNF